MVNVFKLKKMRLIFEMKLRIYLPQYQELNACELGSIISEEEKKYICNKCINNSELVYDEDLNKNNYICKEGYFFDASQEECRKCDELIKSRLFKMRRNSN